MTEKKWLIYVALMILITLGIITCSMYWSDTYSVAHTERTSFYTEPNKNIIKVEYILKNKMKYDSFVFGSSRVGAINPLNIKNGKYYNMTYSEGIPHEHFLNIKLFLNSGVKINNLLIGLDDFSYQVSFDKHQQQGLTKSHYLATETSKFSFYKDYFFRFPLGEDRRHMLNKFYNKNPSYLDVSMQEKDYLKINGVKDFNSSEHLNASIFNKPTHYNNNVLSQTINDIYQINKICKINNINCIFFINPIHQTTFKYLNKELFIEFKKQLGNITQYYDFSNQNSISTNNYYWHETSHYRNIVGDVMLAKIFNDPSIKVPKDFGVLVTKENIDQHLQNLKNQIKAYDLSKSAD
jgi:hypothetical protein